MKTGQIERNKQTTPLPEENMALLNQYTRRELTEDEVFLFSISLCDNEIDRDLEQFSADALASLGALFLGKTGVFDHKPQAAHQAARIYRTELVTAQRANSLGKPYQYLKAWAYMVRCKKNDDLILEIDAGIKKEVSVGCAIKQVLCSVCGANQKAAPCAHEKGEHYGGILCHHVLEQPTDAYEWSFVAVPSQKNAGVIKRFAEAAFSGGILDKIQKSDEALSLSPHELRLLQYQLDELTALAQVGGQYALTLQQAIVRSAAIAQPGLDSAVLEAVTKTMTLPQLEAFRKTFTEAAKEKWNPTPQLAPPTSTEQPQRSPLSQHNTFKI